VPVPFGNQYQKKARPFYPMPNIGLILDISAGTWVRGHRGQWICNGGFAQFWGIIAEPNMFKSTLAAGCAGAVMRAFDDSAMHAHDTESSMQARRVERLVREAMMIDLPGIHVPEDLIEAGRLFFTSSVDMDGTEMINNLKQFAKDRFKNEKQVAYEIIDPTTGKPYMYFTPVIEFTDSFSGLKTEGATEMLEKNDVGSSDNNMLAMKVNSGKSQIIDQAPDLVAKHGIYWLTTGHIGQTYQLDPRKPTVKLLKAMKGDLKIKRIPENYSFQTGNCYAITYFSTLMGDDKRAEFPWSPESVDTTTDLIEIRVTNFRGKFGIDNIPLPLIISKKEGLLPYMSNFYYLLRNANRYGLVGNNLNYALALRPEVSLGRTKVRMKLRESYALQRAAHILMEMHWDMTAALNFPEELRCEPTQLYEEIKAMGYDWDLLLNTRYWHSTVEQGERTPFLSTRDLLLMRVNEYHPYWYPKTRKEMGLPEIETQGSEPTATA